MSETTMKLTTAFEMIEMPKERATIIRNRVICSV
ncbi:hypothetical protein J2Y60_001681 [Arcicella sp. BE140]|nr:hypothetical protein [Arcicella sp. BE51]MDR6811483.1 hypothetical protein [Arcicella sp. BE140]MDR6826023.1 hypothetical protein [Arcicella sp. BE139]